MSSVSASNPNINEVSVDRERLVSGLSLLEISRPQEEQGHADSEQIGEILSRVGLKLKRKWLNERLTELEGSVSDFSRFDLTDKATHCFEKFLVSDMNTCGGGVLPEDIHSMHTDELAGPFVLQVDEIAKTGRLNDRYAFMTDGVRRAVGHEYWPIEDLQVLPPPATLKIVVSKVRVRFGILSLTPTPEIKVLKGVEEARKLVVEAVKNLRTSTLCTEDQQMHIDDDDDYSYSCPDQMGVAQVSDKLLSVHMRDLTYFAELSQKWPRVKNKQPNLEGIIKCSVVGMKRFGFLGKFKYNAVCCASDGVFEYDVRIHSDVVEKLIGHSAQEFKKVVLFSESTDPDIKDSYEEKKRRCRLFLTGFKGMMLVERNKSERYPVATQLRGVSIFRLR